MEGVPVRVVGFDCGEDWHVAVLLDEQGEVELRLDVRNRRDRIEEALAKLVLAIPEGARLQIAIESQRSHGRLVADVGGELGCEIWQVNTIALNHFRDVEGQPRKSDSRDGYLLARMVYLRNRGCRKAVQVLEEERILQRLSRLHKHTVGTRTTAVQQLRAQLLELAPEVLHRDWGGPKTDSKAMLYLLERWPGFEGMERAHLASIVKILRECRYGEQAEEVARSLREMARRIAMASGERSVLTMEMRYVVNTIRSCERTLKEVEREITGRIAHHPVGKRLMEMPGVGLLTAAVLVADLLPVARVSTEGQSATYAGLTPLSRKSGKMRASSRIARGVNKHVLRAMYLSAVASLKRSSLDNAYYKKKLENYAGHPKPHVAALIALARQRHKVMYLILTASARYDKEVLISSHLDRRVRAKDAAA